MSHRGPDDAGEWWSADGRVGLAFRRLSILDLSTAGHQPMIDPSGTLSIVFNGEIYNFKELREELIAMGMEFHSKSDTEVVLASYHQWGTDCLSRFNGMFSFALYDARQQSVFLARDRAGEKPLFYYYDNGILLFASELKALMADFSLPRIINSEALDCYLKMGYVPGEQCILQGFHKLPAAHAMNFNLQNGNIKVWCYWQLPELIPAVVPLKVDETVLLNELENLLEDAVRRQLVADVPVGVLLSGGVDSSIVTAMAVRASKQVQTYTIGFPGHGTLDETEHARLIARHFSTQHTELIAAPVSLNLLPLLARQFDEPLVDSSMIPTYLVSQLVRQHCTVALGGDGGDELFGGYRYYSHMLRMKNHLKLIPRPLLLAVSLSADHLFPVGFKGRNWLQGLGVDFDNGLPMISSLFDANTRRRLMRQHPGWQTSAETVFKGRIPLYKDLLQRATRMDFNNYLAEDILVKVDRSSMLNSLEIRSPFLDSRVIEFAFGKIPSNFKTTHYKHKILLKKLASRILPHDFDQNRKQGFSIPLSSWLLSRQWYDYFRDILMDHEQILFNKQVITKLFEGQKIGYSNSERLFALVIFELWRKEYGVSF
jgi:asparagine synthase (glutamine-hydrolysing)